MNREGEISSVRVASFPPSPLFVRPAGWATAVSRLVELRSAPSSIDILEVVPWFSPCRDIAIWFNEIWIVYRPYSVFGGFPFCWCRCCFQCSGCYWFCDVENFGDQQILVIREHIVEDRPWISNGQDCGETAALEISNSKWIFCERQVFQKFTRASCSRGCQLVNYMEQSLPEGPHGNLIYSLRIKFVLGSHKFQNPGKAGNYRKPSWELPVMGATHVTPLTLHII